MKLTVSTAARETLSREPQSKSSSRPCAHAQWRKMARRGRCTRGSGAACEKAEVCVRGARWRRGRAAGGGRRVGGPGAPAVERAELRRGRGAHAAPRRAGPGGLVARLPLRRRGGPRAADVRAAAARAADGGRAGEQRAGKPPAATVAGSVIWPIGCARAGWLIERVCCERAGSAHQRVRSCPARFPRSFPLISHACPTGARSVLCSHLLSHLSSFRIFFVLLHLICGTDRPPPRLNRLKVLTNLVLTNSVER